MNREIKFRVWDKVDKQFTVLNIGNLRDDYSFDDYIDDTFNDPNSRYILVQYTGLKDKNGNEIYDNDIILYHAIQERFEDIQTGIVTWDQEMSSWVMQIKDMPPGSFYFLYKSLPNDYKIIGNIFENPELLK